MSKYDGLPTDQEGFEPLAELALDTQATT